MCRALYKLSGQALLEAHIGKKHFYDSIKCKILACNYVEHYVGCVHKLQLEFNGNNSSVLQDHALSLILKVHTMSVVQG